MSYYCADINGYIDDVASGGGLAEFCAWAVEHDGPIKRFVEAGVTHDPDELAEALALVSAPGSVEHTRAGIHKCAAQAEEMLILSDGTGDEGGDEASISDARKVSKAMFSAGTAEHKGLLISLWVDDYEAEQLVIPDGEPSHDMHLTLAYCGDVNEIGDLRIARAIVAVADVAQASKALSGKVVGTGRFQASERSDGRDVVYAKPKVSGLAQLREAVVAALANVNVEPRTDYVRWEPHITIAYVAPGVEVEQLATYPALHFDAITISVGTHRLDIPLGSLSNEVKGFDPDQPRDDDTVEDKSFDGFSAVAKAAKNRDEPDLKSSLLHAWHTTKASSESCRTAVETKDWERLAQLVYGAKAATHVRSVVHPRVAAAYLRGVEIGARPLRRMPKKALNFSLTSMNPYAVAWARARAGELLPDPATVRRLVRWFVTDAVEAGFTVDETAQLISEVIGLDERRIGALAAYADELQEDEDFSSSERQALVAAYAEELRDSRAEVVARTEIAMATNAGQQEVWDVALENGTIDDSLRKVWLITEDNVCCDECTALSESEPVEIDEEFEVGLRYPPLHPNCRCTIGLVSAQE